MTTPNDIEVMLHHYAVAQPHPRAMAPAVVEAVARFVKAGLLVQDDGPSGWTPTDRGRAWVRMLLRVPFPRQAWVDEAGNEVLKNGSE